MPLRIDSYSILILLGILQGVLLVAFLFRSNSVKFLQNRQLAYATIALLIVAAGSLAFYSKFILFYPNLLRVHSPFVYLIAPLIYLYVKTNLVGKSQSLQKNWFHFLPFLIALISFSPVYLLSSSKKLVYIREQFIGLTDQQYIFYYTAILSLVFYFILIVKHLWSSYQDRNRPSDQIKQIYKWLLIYSLMLILICSLAVLRIFIGITSETAQWIPLLITIFIYYISFEAIRRPELFQPKTNKYSQSKAKNADLEQMIETVSHLIETEKLYLNEHVSIQDLAKKAQLNVNDLSRALNELLSMNYFDFINSFRLKLAKQMLSSSDFAHYSIEGIGSEAGFKSKASYYAAFKKQLQMTPLEYRSQTVQVSKSKPTD